MNRKAVPITMFLIQKKKRPMDIVFSVQLSSVKSRVSAYPFWSMLTS
jgi:hypothetical protein